MDEAERLADRVAILDRGRLVALDSTAGVVGLAGMDQQVRFRPSVALDDALLTDLPEVREVTRSGRTITVSGTGELVHAVTSVLARNGIVAHDLRIEQAGLDDAYLALTGRAPDAEMLGEAA